MDRETVEMAAQAKNGVLGLIAKLSELRLLEVCDGLNLKLTKTKKDRKSALHNMLVRYVLSEEIEEMEDSEQLDILGKLKTEVQALLDADSNGDESDDDNDGVENENKDEIKEKLIAEQLELEMLKKLDELKQIAGRVGFDVGGSLGDGETSSSSALDKLAATKHLTSSFMEKQVTDEQTTDLLTQQQQQQQQLL